MPISPRSLSSPVSLPVSLSTTLAFRCRTEPMLIDSDMLSGPIVAMVWEGRDAVKTGRSTLSSVDWPRISLTVTAILGATNPLASAPGTIRGDYAIVSIFENIFFRPQLTCEQDVGRNVCHGSDSVENAKKEIALWFKEGEVISYKHSQFDWIYEKA